MWRSELKAKVICSKMEGAGSEMWRDPENRSQPVSDFHFGKCKVVET
jgi:hypothetical protein